MTDKDIKRAFNSLYIKLLDVKYELKITQKEFLALNEVHNLITRQQAEIERLNEYNENLQTANTALSNEILDIKSEAVKEFAEKLKEKYGIAECIVTVDSADIDNLVKENGGENNGST